MSAEFQLIAPLILFAVAAGFFVFWQKMPRNRSALILAVSFTCGALALAVDPMRPFLNEFAAGAISNALLAVTVAGFVAALANWYLGKIAWLHSIGSFALVFCAFLIPFGIGLDIQFRNIAISVAIGTVCMLLAMQLWSRMTLSHDLYLKGLLISVGVMFPMRGLMVLLMETGTITPDNYGASGIASSMHLLSLFSALALAASTIWMFGFRIPTDAIMLSDRDELTGLAKSVIVKERISNDNVGPLKPGHMKSLALIEIDGADQLIAQFGQCAFEALLKTCAPVVVNSVRQIDLTARSDGAHFIVHFDGAAPQMVQMLCESVRLSIQDIICREIGRRPITASIGVVFWSGQTEFGALLETGQKALQLAAQSGGNRVHFKDHASSKTLYRVA